jgi:hypothetical protein
VLVETHELIRSSVTIIRITVINLVLEGSGVRFNNRKDPDRKCFVWWMRCKLRRRTHGSLSQKARWQMHLQMAHACFLQWQYLGRGIDNLKIPSFHPSIPQEQKKLKDASSSLPATLSLTWIPSKSHAIQIHLPTSIWKNTRSGPEGPFRLGP